MSPKRRKHHRQPSDAAREIPIEGAEGAQDPAAAAAPGTPESRPVDPPPTGAAPATEGEQATEAVQGDAAPVEAEATEPTEAAPSAEEIAEARARELEDRLRRVQAEFLNETKRISRQADERTKYAIEALVNDLLPVFDAMHSARDSFAGRAQAAEEAQDESAAAADQAALEGFELVEKELMNVLGRHGVGRIEAVGAVFDPAQHHAIVMVERPDLDPGHVAMELRPGFTLNGRVVRPAHVAVAAAEKES